MVLALAVSSGRVLDQFTRVERTIYKKDFGIFIQRGFLGLRKSFIS